MMPLVNETLLAVSSLPAGSILVKVTVTMALGLVAAWLARANRAAVRAVATADLDLVGIALRAPHRDADAVLRGLSRHP